MTIYSCSGLLESSCMTSCVNSVISECTALQSFCFIFDLFWVVNALSLCFCERAGDMFESGEPDGLHLQIRYGLHQLQDVFSVCFSRYGLHLQIRD